MEKPNGYASKEEMKNAKPDSLLRADTNRGFTRYLFRDRYGSLCRLQKSSLAFEDAVWLSVLEDWNGVEGNTSLHLTRKQVKMLLPKLIRFVFTGKL